MNYDEPSHVAARLQQNFYSHIDVSARTGTPQAVTIDRSTAAAINNLTQSALSLDYLGLFHGFGSRGMQSARVSEQPFDSSRRDTLSFALLQISDAIAKISVGENKSSSSILQSPALRKASSIPLTVHALCGLLSSLDVAVNAINDHLMHTRLDSNRAEDSIGIETRPSSQQQQQRLRQQSRPSSATTTSSHVSARKSSEAVSRNDNKNKKKNESLTDPEAPTSPELVMQQLQKELRTMRDREELLLRKIRDLEIDCRVKAHVVADTTASAQAVFDENTVLRQIAEHNQSLLKEIDALSRCVVENETLNLEIASKDKIIATMKEQLESLKKELRDRKKE